MSIRTVVEFFHGLDVLGLGNRQAQPIQSAEKTYHIGVTLHGVLSRQ